jgi:DNA-binding XRE family transcriptional regulator
MKPRDWAREFRQFRQQTNMSQKRLAEAISVCRRTIAYIEAGVHPPRMSTRFRFSNLLQSHERKGRSAFPWSK